MQKVADVGTHSPKSDPRSLNPTFALFDPRIFSTSNTTLSIDYIQNGGETTGRGTFTPSRPLSATLTPPLTRFPDVAWAAWVMPTRSSKNGPTSTRQDTALSVDAWRRPSSRSALAIMRRQCRVISRRGRARVRSSRRRMLISL